MATTAISVGYFVGSSRRVADREHVRLPCRLGVVRRASILDARDRSEKEHDDEGPANLVAGSSESRADDGRWGRAWPLAATDRAGGTLCEGSETIHRYNRRIDGDPGCSTESLPRVDVQPFLLIRRSRIRVDPLVCGIAESPTRAVGEIPHRQQNARLACRRRELRCSIATTEAPSGFLLARVCRDPRAGFPCVGRANGEFLRRPAFDRLRKDGLRGRWRGP